MKAGRSNSKGFNSVYLEKYVIHATLDEVARLMESLNGLMPRRLSEEQRYAVELGVAEVLTNIVLHGYAGRDNESITVLWRVQAACLRVDILDNGLPIPQDFLMRSVENTLNFDSSDIGNLPESGLGLVLINAGFDVVNYRCSRGMNCMCLKKKF